MISARGSWHASPQDSGRDAAHAGQTAWGKQWTLASLVYAAPFAAPLAYTGIGLLLIEHNIRFVTKMCEHIYVLDSGKMIATGSAEHIMHDPAVVAAYLGSS